MPPLGGGIPTTLSCNSHHSVVQFPPLCRVIPTTRSCDSHHKARDVSGGDSTDPTTDRTTDATTYGRHSSIWLGIYRESKVHPIAEKNRVAKKNPPA
jgi:hypothetical protein